MIDKDWANQLERDGHYLVRGVFDEAAARELRDELLTAIDTADRDGESIRSRGGSVYAARNILQVYPPAVDAWQREPLLSVLRETLGDNFGLVRGLFFDKHPDRSWSLPWHKDMTIAVERNDLPSEQFHNPTTKAGIAHVEAPRELLRQMLTLRIHLDEITEENGPLLVMPGSHNNDAASGADQGEIHTVTSACGDVLLMRPLLSHSSGNSAEGTTRHRRILHLEFAGQEELPDGYRWNFFQPAGAI